MPAPPEKLFSDTYVRELVETFPTPFHLYSEAGIRATAQGLNDVFDWVEPDGQGVGYMNHFAVKATPNPHILDILREEGMGADASSGPEIELALAAEMRPPSIMFTSNDTAPEEYAEAYAAGAVINLDDLNQIDVLRMALGGEFPDTISFRYAPDVAKKADGTNDIIGDPGESKFGVPDWQLEDVYRRAMELGVKHFGIHTMVASNELDTAVHVATAEILFAKVAELSEKLGIDFEFANLGGGLGIPYRPDDEPVDYGALRSGIMQAYATHISDNGLRPLRVLTENGRHVTGPNGNLVTVARSIKETFHRYVGLDASMADLMRPGLYDAYHHVHVVGKWSGEIAIQRLVGSLCENNDHFTGSQTRERALPMIEPGDIVVIHDTGAHGHAMGFNYNGKTRSAEYLQRPDGTTWQIRRAETRNDLFATLDHQNLRRPVRQA